MRTHLGLPAVVITGVSSGPFASGPTNRGEGVEGVLHTGWHNPAAAYRAATLALQDGYYGGWFGRLPKRREVDGLFRRAMKDDP